MKIIIVGGGKVGFYLAQTLSAQGHEAAIIEQDRELCRMIANQLDISICTGDGTSQDVLREAGAERADVVCAVTGKDESNLVCCQTAKKVFDVKKTVRLGWTRSCPPRITSSSTWSARWISQR